MAVSGRPLWKIQKQMGLLSVPFFSFVIKEKQFSECNYLQEDKKNRDARDLFSEKGTQTASSGHLPLQEFHLGV